MRRLFFTIFLWFWLTLVAVALVLVLLVAHAGFGYRSLLRLSLHDLLLFSVAGGIFCYFVSSYLTKPLYKLGEAAANIADAKASAYRIRPRSLCLCSGPRRRRMAEVAIPAMVIAG